MAGFKLCSVLKRSTCLPVSPRINHLSQDRISLQIAQIWWVQYSSWTARDEISLLVSTRINCISQERSNPVSNCCLQGAKIFFLDGNRYTLLNFTKLKFMSENKNEKSQKIAHLKSPWVEDPKRTWKIFFNLDIC